MRFFLILILLISSSIVYCQLLYPIKGSFMKKSAQSMAIWNDKAFLFNNTGICRVLNLKSGKTEKVFDLGSRSKNTHVNSACFGNEVVPDSEVPLLYISETRKPYRCFVECIRDTNSVVVQTISPLYKGHPMKVTSWVLDRENGHIYALARFYPVKGKDSDIIRIYKYQQPSLMEGSFVQLTENDCLDVFDVRFSSALQDCIIKDGLMYIATGFQQLSNRNYYKERAVQVIDLKKRKMVKQISLANITTNEPEGLDFYKGMLFLFVGQKGGIYQIDN